MTKTISTRRPPEVERLYPTEIHLAKTTSLPTPCCRRCSTRSGDSRLAVRWKTSTLFRFRNSRDLRTSWRCSWAMVLTRLARRTWCASTASSARSTPRARFSMTSRPRWMTPRFPFQTSSMQGTPRSLTQRAEMLISRKHFYMRIILTSKHSSKLIKQGTLMLTRLEESSCRHPRKLWRQRRRLRNRRCSRQRPCTSFALWKMVQLTQRIRLYFLSQDLSQVIYTWLRKNQTQNIICWCKMTSTLMVTLNGSSSKLKTLEKELTSSSTSRTLPNPTPSSTLEWK